MVRALLSTLIAFLLPASAYALEETHYNYHEISSFIEAVKSRDKSEISKYIRYPFRREHPVPDIHSERELILRFNEVFDEKLLALIASSNIESDWSQVGWRGVMLRHGALWIDGGKVIVINYQTQLEKQYSNKIIQKQKSQLHSGLQKFQEPILEWDTISYHIRIDQLEPLKYRYASWKRGVPTSNKPDLILADGVRDGQGSGGNHWYDFVNGDYLYRCSVIYVGTSYDPPGRLEVYKNGDLILSEDLEKNYE